MVFNFNFCSFVVDIMQTVIRVFLNSEYLILNSFFNNGVDQKGKKFCVLYELGNKMHPGAWGHCKPLIAFSGGSGGGGGGGQNPG